VAARRKPGRPAQPDISFTAEVNAGELRFHEEPETRVEFTGTPGHESASGSDRHNLPPRVRASATYRDVRVDYRLAAKVRCEPGDDATGRG
jgi:hypothetical protein